MSNMSSVFFLAFTTNVLFANFYGDVYSESYSIRQGISLFIMVLSIEQKILAAAEILLVQMSKNLMTNLNNKYFYCWKIHPV